MIESVVEVKNLKKSYGKVEALKGTKIRHLEGDRYG